MQNNLKTIVFLWQFSSLTFNDPKGFERINKFERNSNECMYCLPPTINCECINVLDGEARKKWIYLIWNLNLRVY